MVKVRTQQLLSLRAKLKTPDMVEVTVIDLKTGELFAIQWTFRSGTVKDSTIEETPTEVAEKSDVKEDE